MHGPRERLHETQGLPPTMSSTIHVSGPGIDRRVTLNDGAPELTVGRDAAADVHLPEKFGRNRIIKFLAQRNFEAD